MTAQDADTLKRRYQRTTRQLPWRDVVDTIFTGIPVDSTFTPTVTFATVGDFSPTYNTQTGLYKTEGKTVWISFLVDFDTNAYTTAAGNFRVTALPLASANQGIKFGLSIGRMTNVTIASTHLTTLANVVENAAYVEFSGVRTATTPVSYGTTQFPASTTGIVLECTGTYFID